MDVVARSRPKPRSSGSARAASNTVQPANRMAVISVFATVCMAIRESPVRSKPPKALPSVNSQRRDFPTGLRVVDHLHGALDEYVEVGPRAGGDDRSATVVCQ